MELHFVNLDPQYVLLAILGMLIHIFMKIERRSNQKERISMKFYFSQRKNWIHMILSILSTFALILMADDIASIMGITVTDDAPAKSLFAFTAGYLNHSLVRDVLGIARKRIKKKKEGE